MNAFMATLSRDLLIARREGGESQLAVIFFVLGAMLFPLGVGPEGKLLALMAAGVIWVMALLATHRQFEGMVKKMSKAGMMKGSDKDMAKQMQRNPKQAMSNINKMKLISSKIV